MIPRLRTGRKVSFLLAGLFLVRLAWAETVELVTSYPTTAGGGIINTDSLAVGSDYSGQTPPDGTLLVADKVAIGTTTPAGPLHAVGVDDAASLVIFEEGTDTAATGTPEIRLGLGTDTPQEQLHLTGNLILPKTTATSGAIYLGADPFIHGYHDAYNNLFVGAQAGNFTMDSSASCNIGIGALALNGLTEEGQNTGVGYKTFFSTTEGNRSVAVGSKALSSHMTGDMQVAIGADAMLADEAGFGSVAVGCAALSEHTFVANNVAIGYGVMNELTANSSVAVGYFAMHASVNPIAPVAIGAHALENMESGHYQNAVGALALSSSTAADYNTAVGFSALQNNTIGEANDAFGAYALNDNTTMDSNIAIGTYALMHNTVGIQNLAVGVEAVRNSSNHRNLALGRSALRDSTTGRNNVVIGFEAGVSATGNYNVFIGSQAGSNETGDNTLYIENSASSTPLIYGEFDNDLIAINGNLGVGTSTFGTGAVGVLAIAEGTIPGSSPANQIQLYAEEVSSSSELKVRDEGGTITTLSPHNFTLIPQGPSEPMAWSFYSKRGTQAINADILKTVRLIEKLSGEQLVWIKSLSSPQPPPSQTATEPSALLLVQQELETLKAQNQILRQRLKQQRGRIQSFQGALQQLKELLR